MKRKWIRTALISVMALTLAVFGGGWYLLDVALVTSPDRDASARRFAALRADYPDDYRWADSLWRCGILRDTFLLMPDGERHHALYARQSTARGRTALLIHGYTDSSVSMLPIARIYYDTMGFDLLLPDLHGHGLSDGEEAQMGWLDRLSVMEWIKAMSPVFRHGADSLQIVVHGVSMGAATTMCVAGEATPASVRCFVEDCGYTSVWDEFGGELHVRYGLPKFPLLHAASLLCRLRYGWDFDRASPLEALTHCHKPMLFIHGAADTYVPTAMVYPLYRAHAGPKQLWIARGSRHAAAYRDHRAEYTRRVAAFVRQYIR